MTTTRTLMLLAAGLAGVVLSGCGADVPENPTWVADVRPIFVARCVRCHDATLGETDPLSRMGTTHAIGNFSYASFSDFSDGDKGAILTSDTRIQNPSPVMVMPPPPAALLADWQIQTIKNWIKNPQ